MERNELLVGFGECPHCGSTEYTELGNSTLAAGNEHGSLPKLSDHFWITKCENSQCGKTFRLKPE